MYMMILYNLFRSSNSICFHINFMADYEVPSWCLYVTICLTVMNELILIPTLIYYTWKFLRLRNDTFFQKRRPKLILAYVICMGINPFLRPLMLYTYWYATETLWIKMMAYIPYALAFGMAFLRYWLTLYDFKCNEALYLQKIKKHIAIKDNNNKSLRVNLF